MLNESMTPQQTDRTPSVPEGVKRKSRRRKTAHLKIVPPTRDLREQIRSRCGELVDEMDKSRPLTKDEMEQVVRSLLETMELPEGYVGWTMVMLASSFWRDQVAAIPPSRRLFLLPHCLKHAEGCPADYDEFGLDCEKCGACSIADFRSVAEEKGYKVLVAEGSPIVLKIIISGYVDAIVGVACLNVLEKAIDKLLLAGIPCFAIPLLSSDCRNTSVDEDWVHEMIHLSRSEPVEQTRSYVHLMRAASSMFEPQELERLAPRTRRATPPDSDAKGNAIGSLDPISATEALAYDFLAKGGKHARPFITLAVYDALTGADATSAGGVQYVERYSEAVRRTAMSIEIFHKASLVHDDIEDDDAYRYGDDTIHRKHGTPTAINVGDYLIGMGYRMVSREVNHLGPDTVSDILDCLARSHMKLTEGQGAELIWRDSRDKQLSPVDALKIYALKTSPAFEAALYAGARLAGPAESYAEKISQFARHLGIAFQILNDLKDWEGDDNNKLLAGGDVLAERPTVLWAMAWNDLSRTSRHELQQVVNDNRLSQDSRINRVRWLYREADVFDRSRQLVDRYQQRAEEIADDVQPDELRRLFYYLIDTILERPDDAPSDIVVPTLVGHSTGTVFPAP